MAQVSCSRCFAVFEAGGSTPGAAPLCAACAQRVPARPGPTMAPLEGRRAASPARRGRRAAWGVVVLAALAGAAALVRSALAPATAPAAPTVVERCVEEWRAAGLLQGVVVRDAAGRGGAARGRSGGAGRGPAGAHRRRRPRLPRGARAAPRRSDAAIAGYATAFAEAAGEDASGSELRAAHEMVREALAAGGRPELEAAYARLLLLVQSPANDAEALAVATRAGSAAPSDPSVRLAAGLAQLRRDAPSAARQLEDAAAAFPGDRRLLTAAARAHWAAGDAERALALCARRLALDPGHPGALSLRAEILAASDRIRDAREALERWAAADPRAALPHVLLARLAYQRDDDLASARQHLDAALARGPDDFTAARALAHRAAVELAAGDTAAAEAAVADALRRVPASAPARFQAAVLAFRRREAARLRESAGVLGDRGGAVTARVLAARSAELSGTDEEAQEAWAARGRGRAPRPRLAPVRRRRAGPAPGRRPRARGRAARARARSRRGAAPARAHRLLGRRGAARRGLAPARGARAGRVAGRGARVRRGRGLRAPARADRRRRAARAARRRTRRRSRPRRSRCSRRSRSTAATRAARSDTRTPRWPRSRTTPSALAVRARALEALGRNLDAEQANRVAAEAGPRPPDPPARARAPPRPAGRDPRGRRARRGAAPRGSGARGGARRCGSRSGLAGAAAGRDAVI